MSGRYFDKRVHPCGCRTIFDTERWASVSQFTCEFHAQYLRHEAADSGRPTDG